MAHRILFAALALLSAATQYGCGSGRATAGAYDRSTIERTTAPELEALGARVDVVPDGSGYALIFSAGASGSAESATMTALRGISKVTFIIVDPDGIALDSVSSDVVERSGVVQAGGASLTASVTIPWTPSEDLEPGGYVVMRADADAGTIYRVAELPMIPRASERLALALDVEDRGTGVEFILDVERMAPAPANEYIPTGEQFRIELFSDEGERIWSSSTGRMFTQALGPVAPGAVGQRVTYRAHFDGRNDITHARLRPGRYRVVATIPAEPTAYVLREEFTWGG